MERRQERETMRWCLFIGQPGLEKEGKERWDGVTVRGVCAVIYKNTERGG